MKKHFVRKIVLLTLASSLIFANSVNSFASSQNSATIINSTEMNIIVKELKKIDASDPKQVEAILSDLVKQDDKKTTIKNMKSNGEVAKPIVFSSKKKVSLNNSTSVIFDNIQGTGIITIERDRPKNTNKQLYSASYSGSNTVAGTKDFDCYAPIGLKLFTVTQDYSFSISNSTGRGIISCNYGRGYFSPGTGSPFTGNIWTDVKSNKVTSYGTATASVTVWIFNLNVSSINYNAAITCDAFGNVDSNISYDPR